MQIAHILRGTLGAYSQFFLSHCRRKAFSHSTILALLFVIGNVLGRLSVALIGLTYTVDDEIMEVIPPLRGVIWPEIGKSMRNQSIFLEPLLSEDTMMDLLREITTVEVPISKPVKIDMDDKGLGIVKDLSFLDIPGMELSIEKPNEAAGSVKYIYVLPDVDGDPAIRVERKIEIMAECARVTIADLKRGGILYLSTFAAPAGLFLTTSLNIAMSSSTFYPTIVPTDDQFSSLYVTGWTFFSHPKNREDGDCGPSCVKFGM